MQFNCNKVYTFAENKNDMQKITLLILMFACSIFSFSQEIEGKILDAETNETLYGVQVYSSDFEIGTISDIHGRFHFQHDFLYPSRFRFSLMGYESQFILLDPSDTAIVVLMTKNHLNLEEVLVQSNARGTLQRDNVSYIETRKLSELKSIPSIGLGDALSQIPGVYNSSTGTGISKPVIRGLQGTRIVTMLNGLRIENQQWGGDHGMGISELGIGQIEVIKGPASILYGADALGGVLYFVDEAYAKQNHQSLTLQTQFNSNSLGTSNQLIYKNSQKKSRFSIAGLFSDFADYQIPNGRYAADSRFKEKALKMNYSYNQKNWVIHFKYNFQSNRVGIPGHSHDSIPNPLDFQITKQERKNTIPAQVIQNHFISVENKFFFAKTELSILTGFTSNQLAEFEEKFTVPGISMRLNNYLAKAQVKNTWNEKWTLLYGVQSMFQDNINKKDATEILMPTARTADIGVFALGFFSLKKWNFQAGARTDLRHIESLSIFEGQNLLKRQFGSFNGALGAVRNSKKYTWRANVSSGFRAPHLTELLANGFHHGALRYEIGNIDLKAEQAVQLDLNFEFHHEHLEININPFINVFQNFIVLNPIDSIAEGLPVYKYEQVDFAQTMGIDLAWHYHPHFAHWLHLENSYSYIYASGPSKSALPFTPQARIQTELKVEFAKKRSFYCENIQIQHHYLFAQNRVSIFETSSNAYQIINLAAHFKWKSKSNFSFDIGIRNLLNQNYIDHLSRLKNIQLASPGINFFLAGKFQIEYKNKNHEKTK